MFDQFLRVGPFLGVILFMSSSAVVYPRQSHAVKAVLALGESLKVRDTGVTVSFEEVVEDSRCPTGVTCIWEGDAAVKISIHTPDTSPSSYTLHTSQRFAREAEHGGYRVVLVAVTPHPAA